MKILFFSFFLVLFISSNLKAETKCLYSQDKTNKPVITWTAFKTPKKIGVNGTFSKINISSSDSDDLNKFIVSSKAEIEAQSVSTNNEERDQKLVKYFFKPMKKNNIEASIVGFKENNILMLLSMNGVKKEITMKYENKDNKVLIFSGSIDILNWSLAKELTSLNKACMDLHEKKTWSEIELKIEVPITYECLEKI